jgi:hypothetical protein
LYLISFGLGMLSLALGYLSFNLFKSSFKKYKRIVKPRPMIRYEETYCIFNALMLRTVQVLLILYFIYSVIAAVTFIVGGKYQVWFLQTTQESCSLIPTFKNTHFYILLVEKAAELLFGLVILF